MSPSKVERVINYYHSLMKGKDISFLNTSFEGVEPQSSRDVVYLDPPYTNTNALYFGGISLESLLSWIEKLKCSWYMNINGVNSRDNEENISISYTGREILQSGNSSFSRMKGRSVNVGEYFYYKTSGVETT